MSGSNGHQVKMIPIDQINVLNPRSRGRAKFQQIVRNIEHLGLKKPICVALHPGQNGTPSYDLVCGQGRIEALQALGATEIPALVIEATKEEVLLMSLTENLARRSHTSVELVKRIVDLRDRHYSFAQIASKTDLELPYVKGILRLLQKGEERLVRAVEAGEIPLTIAITIATADDQQVQVALREAYESKALRGKELLRARRLIEKRRTAGKGSGHGPAAHDANGNKAQDLLRTYRKETHRQRDLIKKSKITETRLLFLVNGLRQLFKDDAFVKLLKTDSLDTLPTYLADQIYQEG